MFPKRFPIACILALSLVCSLQVNAQTAKAEQQKLTAMQGKVAQKRTEMQQFKQELESAKAARASMSEGAGPEKDELDKAAAALEEAKATAAADPSDTNDARVKNAEFKHALAERKYKKANAELYDLEDRIDGLSSQMSATSGEIDSLDKQIAAQQLAVEQARTKEVAAKKAQEAELQRMKAEAAAAEQSRLKAELERKQREEAARKAAELAAAEKAAAAKAAAAKAPAAPAMAAPAPKAPAAATSAAPAAAAAAGSNIVLLTSKQAVADEQKRLQDLLATPDRGKPGYNKILNVKPIGPDGQPGASEAHSLQPLGHNQYRGVARIKGGAAVFVIGFHNWQQTVPGSAEAKDYVVVLDASDSKSPRLIYYPESLAN